MKDRGFAATGIAAVALVMGGTAIAMAGGDTHTTTPPCDVTVCAFGCARAVDVVNSARAQRRVVRSMGVCGLLWSGHSVTGSEGIQSRNRATDSTGSKTIRSRSDRTTVHPARSAAELSTPRFW